MAEVLRYVNTASSAGGDGTTNNTSGATRAYASLAEWEAAEQTDLVSDGDTHRVVCEGTAADTTAVDINGWTMGSSNYLTIETDPTAAAGRHNTGTYSTSHYRLEVSAVGVIRDREHFVRIYGLQLNNSSDASSGTVIGIYQLNNTGSGEVYAGYNIIRYTGAGTPDVNSDAGILLNGNDGSSYIYNNLIYDYGSGITRSAGAAGFEDVIYNNTIHNVGGTVSTQRGIQITDATATDINYWVKNNIVQDMAPSSGNCYSFTAGATTEITADNIADDTSSPNNDHDSVEVAFRDESNDDFRYAFNATDGIGEAEDLSTDTDGKLSFSDDILGRPREGWDIGCFERHFTPAHNNRTVKGNMAGHMRGCL